MLLAFLVGLFSTSTRLTTYSNLAILQKESKLISKVHQVFFLQESIVKSRHILEHFEVTYSFLVNLSFFGSLKNIAVIIQKISLVIKLLNERSYSLGNV